MHIGQGRGHMVLVALTALAVRASAAGASPSPPAASLERCAKTVSKEASKLERGSLQAMESCLQAMSKAVVRDGSTPATAAASVAPACARWFHRFNDSRGRGVSLAEKTAARIAAMCDPASRGVTHALDDVTGK